MHSRNCPPLGDATTTDDCLAWWTRIMDALPFYALLVDANHQIVASNRALLEHLHLESTPHDYCPRVVHGLEEPYPGCPLETAVATRSPEETVLYDEGSRTWTHSAVYPTEVMDSTGHPLFLHFARDITREKTAEDQLAQSLEHHKALGRLLQAFQASGSEEESLSTFADLTLGLSWMDVTSGCAVFLLDGTELRRVVSRKLDPRVLSRCERVPLGRCICGRVAETGRPEILGINGSHERDHSVPVLPEDHGHATFPLIHKGETLGVVTFYLLLGRELQDHQLEFLRAAMQVTAADVAERRARRLALAAQEKATTLERRFLERVIASQEEERRRVARELHDDLGQALSALLLDVRTAASAKQPFGESAAHFDRSIREVITRLYELSWNLRPAVLDDFGLDSALRRYVERLTQRHGLCIDYDFVGDPGLTPRLPREIELALYRLAQEALSNIIRHAAARRASLLVYRHAGSVTLLVEDDGRGFDPKAAVAVHGEHGLGLTGMRERAALLQGQLVIESEEGSGTSIRVTLPIDREHPGADPA